MNSRLSKLETRLKAFVDGEVQLPNLEALELMREYRLESQRESEIRWKESEARWKELDKILEQLSCG